MNNFSFILTSFFVATILTFLYLPLGLMWLGPFWLVLVLLHWVLVAPQYINVGFAFFTGLFLDIIYNTHIGVHALALVFVVFLLARFGGKIKLFSVWKKFIVICILMIVYQLILSLIQTCWAGGYFNFYYSLLGAFVSSLLWFPLYFLLYKRKIQLSF